MDYGKWEEDMRRRYVGEGHPQFTFQLYHDNALYRLEPPEGVSVLRYQPDFIDGKLVVESALEGQSLSEAMVEMLLGLEKHLKLAGHELLQWTKRLALDRGQSIDLMVEPPYRSELSNLSFHARDFYGPDQEQAFGPNWREQPVREWEHAFRDGNLVAHAFGEDIRYAYAHGSTEAAKADFQIYRELFEAGQEGVAARVARLTRPRLRSALAAG